MTSSTTGASSKVDEAESLNSERDFADRGGSASQTPRGNPLIGEVLFLRKILRARLLGSAFSCVWHTWHSERWGQSVLVL